MKQFLFTITLLLIFDTTISAQNFNASQFYTKGSYNEVHQIANKKNKKLMVVFGAVWCIPCKKLENEVFTDSEVNQYIKDNFIVLKADVDFFEFMDLAEEHQVNIYPTTMVFDKNDSILERFSGVLTIDELLSKLMIMNVNYEISHPNEAVLHENKIIQKEQNKIEHQEEKIIEENYNSSIKDEAKKPSSKKKCKKKK